MIKSTSLGVRLLSVALASLTFNAVPAALASTDPFESYIKDGYLFEWDQCLNTWVSSPIPCAPEGGAGGGSLDSPLATPEVNISSIASGSIIDVNTMNHTHRAIDYISPSVGGVNCSSCVGGNIVVNSDPHVGLIRLHSSREAFKNSSLGIGVFLSYDVNLNLFEKGGRYLRRL